MAAEVVGAGEEKEKKMAKDGRREVRGVDEGNEKDGQRWKVEEGDGGGRWKAAGGGGEAVEGGGEAVKGGEGRWRAVAGGGGWRWRVAVEGGDG